MSSTRSFKNPGIFADNATTVIPPTPIAGVAYRDAVTGTDDTPNGWRYGTRVASQDWNQVMFLLTSMMGMIDSQGVLGWSDQVDYAVPALVFGSNGLPYIALQASGPATAAQDPISAPLYWEQFSLHGRVVLASSQSWTVPMAMQLGYVRPFVEVRGAGGGGARLTTGSGPSGGGGGGIAKRVVDLSGVPTVSVTVGSGGAGGATDGAAGVAGGSSAFGAFASATGGGGGTINGATSAGGIGSGGDINISIGRGHVALRSADNSGFQGGAGGGTESPFANIGTELPTSPGQGGGGRVGNAGITGANGVVIIEW